MSAERVLQAAIVTALRANAAYRALVDDVYDEEAPALCEMPFTLIGEMTEVADRTHDFDGYDHTVTIHDWSDYQGRKEVQEIREARNAVLHPTILTVTGWGLTKLMYEFGEVITERDEALNTTLRHQVTRYRVHSLEAA